MEWRWEAEWRQGDGVQWQVPQKCTVLLLVCLFDSNLEKQSPRLLTPPPIHQHLIPTNLSVSAEDLVYWSPICSNRSVSHGLNRPPPIGLYTRPDSKMDKSKAKSKMKMNSRGSYSPRTRNRVHAFDSSQQKPPPMMADSRAISRRCWRKWSKSAFERPLWGP